MNFQIVQLTEQVAVIRLYGELDHHETEKIRADISQTILQGQLTTIIWNLTDLNFMDSAGIGLILGRMRELRVVDGQTLILNPSKTMQKMFQFSGLAAYVLEASEKEALLHVRGIVNG